MTSLNLAPRIYLDRKAQIASLLTEEIKILDKYSDFTNVLSEKKALEFLERTKLNEYTINLKDGKQPSYGLIYSLGPVKLKILKTYIKTYLKIGFIQPFKSPTDALILFNKKLDSSFCPYIDYQGLNNLIIKNWYTLL